MPNKTPNLIGTSTIRNEFSGEEQMRAFVRTRKRFSDMTTHPRLRLLVVLLVCRRTGTGSVDGSDERRLGCCHKSVPPPALLRNYERNGTPEKSRWRGKAKRLLLSRLEQNE